MRRAILTAIPVLGLVMMLQISIASRIMLLSGNVDLLLLVVAAWGLQERVKAAWIWGLLAGLLAWFRAFHGISTLLDTFRWWDLHDCWSIVSGRHRFWRCLP